MFISTIVSADNVKLKEGGGVVIFFSTGYTMCL